MGANGTAVQLLGVSDETCIADHPVEGGLPRYRLYKAPGGFGFGPTYGLIIERSGESTYTVCKFNDARDCYCNMNVWIHPDDLSGILRQACQNDPDLEKMHQEFHA